MPKRSAPQTSDGRGPRDGAATVLTGLAPTSDAPRIASHEQAQAAREARQHARNATQMERSRVLESHFEHEDDSSHGRDQDVVEEEIDTSRSQTDRAGTRGRPKSMAQDFGDDEPENDSEFGSAARVPASNLPDEDSDDDVPKSAAKVRKLKHAQGEREGDDYRVEDGVVYEPFNLKAERESGYYDAAGNYVWTNNPNEDTTDAWLAEVDEADADGRHVLPPVTMKESSASKITEEAETPVDIPKALQILINLLRPEETVSAALRRLGKAHPHARERGNASQPPMKQSYKSSSRNTSTSNSTEPMSTEQTKSASTEQAASLNASYGSSDTQQAVDQSFNELTDAADELVRAGQVEIFSTKREILEEQLQKLYDAYYAQYQAAQAQTQNATEIDEDSLLWEFKWSKDASETFGPYSSTQMYAWQQAGSFSAPKSEENSSESFDIYLRRVVNEKKQSTTDTSQKNTASTNDISSNKAASKDDLLADLEDEEMDESETSRGQNKQNGAQSSEGKRHVHFQLPDDPGDAAHWDWTPLKEIDLRKYAAME